METLGIPFWQKWRTLESPAKKREWTNALAWQFIDSMSNWVAIMSLSLHTLWNQSATISSFTLLSSEIQDFYYNLHLLLSQFMHIDE